MDTTDKYWIGFGDIHENLSVLHRIPGIENANGIIIHGDITNRGNSAQASKILNKIRKINPNIYAQIGNMDLPEITAYLEGEGWNIHSKGMELADGLGIMGVGYSMPTPFGTPAEVPDSRLAHWLNKAFEQVKHLPKLILVAHDPPFGSKADVLPSGMNVGSRAVLEFIRRVQPDFCLTGHIHEARSTDFIGKTKVINPGLFGQGGYALIRYTDGELKADLMSV